MSDENMKIYLKALGEDTDDPEVVHEESEILNEGTSQDALGNIINVVGQSQWNNDNNIENIWKTIKSKINYIAIDVEQGMQVRPADINAVFAPLAGYLKSILEKRPSQNPTGKTPTNPPAPQQGATSQGQQKPVQQNQGQPSSSKKWWS